MRLGFVLVLLMTSNVAKADLTFEPRVESIYSSQAELSQRAILKSKVNWGRGPFSFFIDGFAEVENNEVQAAKRRSPNRGYLQEGYFEFKGDAIFVRLGRQALRWSETWTLPSLDIWTGRKWNRLFFDPFADQLNHPTGASLSYAKNDYSIDFVLLNELAENNLPEPLPNGETSNEMSYGSRLKWMWGNLGLGIIGAQSLKKNYYGVSGNFAFDKMVPKFEIGSRHDDAAQYASGSDQAFITLGCDVFSGQIIFLPQMSIYEVAVADSKKLQATFYGSLQWNPSKHDVLLQAFQNIATEDVFLSGSYGYNFTEAFKVTGFMQNYYGSQGLYRIYQELTGGGLIVGARVEYTGSLNF